MTANDSQVVAARVPAVERRWQIGRHVHLPTRGVSELLTVALPRARVLKREFELLSRDRARTFGGGKASEVLFAIGSKTQRRTLGVNRSAQVA
jgi:hypothetical protein